MEYVVYGGMFRRSKWRLLRRYGWRSRHDIFYVGGISSHFDKFVVTMRNLPRDFCEKNKSLKPPPSHVFKQPPNFSNAWPFCPFLGGFLTQPNLTSSFTQNHGLIFEGNPTSSMYGVFTYMYPVNYRSHPHSPIAQRIVGCTPTKVTSMAKSLM